MGVYGGFILLKIFYLGSVVDDLNDLVLLVFMGIIFFRGMFE